VVLVLLSPNFQEYDTALVLVLVKVTARPLAPKAKLAVGSAVTVMKFDLVMLSAKTELVALSITSKEPPVE
jgi:hypothetical protein